ncbi:hypothetical protein FOYG_10461 [Fusarium oxysporum NRRL 32931]|uniref:C2H2-type domain-containing protein n=1 Tax=Fusarium oxysporum NRRL 32931 TaxID=660029 RepID=W9I4T4_FUSOX|nr:hypothetical protein FOYG_10461 [Fusarium oxysporum NRRL 32931]
MNAEWQYNLLDEDMSLIMNLNDPFGSIPPEMDLSLFDSYQPADNTALTMGDPLLGLAIACDDHLPDGAYPDFLADVTSRTDNSSFPNTDCLTTFDELIVSDVLGSSQNSMDHVTFSSSSSLSPGFESTIISPCITRSPALWHSPEMNYMRNNISSSSSAHQYSPLSSATLSTPSPSIPINESSLAQKGKATRGKKSPLRNLSRDLRHIFKPEVCHLCFKGHPYTRELEEHIKVHHPAEASRLRIDMTRPVCNACRKTFSRPCNLKRHMDHSCKGLPVKE